MECFCAVLVVSRLAYFRAAYIRDRGSILFAALLLSDQRVALSRIEEPMPTQEYRKHIYHKTGAYKKEVFIVGYMPLFVAAVLIFGAISAISRAGFDSADLNNLTPSIILQSRDAVIAEAVIGSLPSTFWLAFMGCLLLEAAAFTAVIQYHGQANPKVLALFLLYAAMFGISVQLF